jgi:hypothetical protein
MPKPLGYRLFLAMLYVLSRLAWTQGNVQGELPKGYSLCIMAAACLLFEKTKLELWTEIFNEHLERYDRFRHMSMEDRFFVTKRGIFGRAPAEAVKQSQSSLFSEGHMFLIFLKNVRAIMSLSAMHTWKES